MMSLSDLPELNKILVIQTASIGDVILASPILEKFHFHFPKAQVDILVKKGNESLFDSHPFLHKVLIWDKSSSKYKNLIKLHNYTRFQNYDCVINLQRFLSSGILTVFSGAKIKIGFSKNPLSIFFTKRIKHTIRKGNVHEIERNLKLVQPITDETLFPVKLYPSQKDFARMSQYKTVKYITISPSSLWFTKQFPKEKWVQFVQEIESSITIYFLGSKQDYQTCDDIIKLSGHKNSLNLSGKLNFLESAALMRDATMNFMNDSAPMHLASAINAPTTAIYCSTVPSFGFGPLSEDTCIVESNEELDCRPCGLHGFRKCPKKHFKCALTINNQELINRIP